MTGFNVIMVLAIILFARLGVRLYVKWKQLKSDEKNEEGENEEDSRAEK